MSDFFKRMRLDKHTGVSPTTLRTLLRRMEELLVRYQKKHESESAGKSVREIIAGGDETFFNEMMVLVMMDLSSGYIVTEEEAVDRSYETWRTKVESRMKELGLTARHFITVSEAVHAFSADGSPQTSEQVEEALEEQASTLEETARTHSIPDNKGALKKFRGQMANTISRPK